MTDLLAFSLVNVKSNWAEGGGAVASKQISGTQ